MSGLQKSELPAIRACFFDLDGLLINSEDVYMLITDEVLYHFGSPSVPWAVRAKLQGLSHEAASKVFRSWVQLPIDCEDEFIAMTDSLQKKHFPNIRFMPGAIQLLRKLSTPSSLVQLGIVSSSSRASFDLKTSHLTEMLSVFHRDNIVLGDDTRILPGRAKPAPDMYLTALKVLNDRLRAEGNKNLIRPEECLVFEDSLSGLEAGGRAGMRVVWCPHPGFVEYARNQETTSPELLFSSKSALRAVKYDLLDTGGCLEMDDNGWITWVSSLEDVDLTRLGVLGHSGAEGAQR